MFVVGNGLLAGLVLAGFLALCDGLFGTRTFSVLIDVGYVPGMENLPSVVELLIHLLISVAIACVWVFVYPRSGKGREIKFSLYWMLAFALLFFPFSFLSGADLSWMAFLIWVLGHLIYTGILAVQIHRLRSRSLKMKCAEYSAL
ncbi:hypothetical protein [Brevibacillus centrosporus]|uniref:hypothetical protein n=1 Tax=Brevibacillus centrosporus TaxID=54910 RepID=UPI003819D6BF